MISYARTRKVLGLALLGVSLLAGTAQAGIITQTASLPLTPTDFGPNSPGAGSTNPLVFQQFDTQNGERLLDSVTLNFSASIQNNFGMQFTTPATITTTVATGNADTPGPTITLFQPDGTTPLLTVKAPNDPNFLTRTVTYGFGAGQTLPQSFNSGFATNSPFYLAPASSQASNSLKLTSAADLALFTGAGNLRMPVTAAAFAQITSSSGNGFGKITTKGTADVTISYDYHLRSPAPQTVPEPSTALLFAVGGLGLFAARRVRPRLAA